MERLYSAAGIGFTKAIAANRIRNPVRCNEISDFPVKAAVL